MGMELPVINRLGTALRSQRASRLYGIEALAKLLETYLTPGQIAEVRRAHEFGARRHRGQFRKSGEPYIYHPLAVARILAEMRQDHVTLIAAILHDVIEDTPTAKEELAAQFGPEVAILVDGVSKLGKAEFQSRAEAQAENFRKLLMAMAQDIRVIMVKLADRLHNMRTLDAMAPDKRRRIARETLEIYAPIAYRLGIYTWRQELEDLGLKALYPKRYDVLKLAVRQASNNRKNLVHQVEERLTRALREEGIHAEVVGRKKNIYSIYQKMRRKTGRFIDVLDLYGFRIIVDNVDNCYRALGVAHHVFRPIPEQFNDFIANPKVNGYQSLHTTLVGPGGVKIELQIRTREMHQIAESGIAAHWLYKTGDSGAKAPEVRAREWLANLLELQQGAGSPSEFIENVKVDLFPDEVYLFTPKGDIFRLPKGATAVDFAYAVHTELGNHCIAARIDGRLVPLSTVLRNGQTVEVITARDAQPNPAWLNFVKSAKARASLRHYLKNLQRDEAESLGKRLLEKSFKELKLGRRQLTRERIAQALATMKVASLQELHVSIGLGQRLAPLVARNFLPAASTAAAAAPQPLALEGTEGLVVEYAKCCHPIPGDEIRGHVSVGRGLVIHRADCRDSLRKASEQERINLCWSEQVEGEFPVELRVQARNRRGTLARLAAQIAEADCNIENVVIPDRGGEIANVRFLIAVRDRRHLAQVVRRLRQLDNVERVTRS
jgi:GTP diphosphokinase / guanosine-3',5'-bis(diphosphate) 3'-diphosphatase